MILNLRSYLEKVAPYLDSTLQEQRYEPLLKLVGLIEDHFPDIANAPIHMLSDKIGMLVSSDYEKIYLPFYDFVMCCTVHFTKEEYLEVLPKIRELSRTSGFPVYDNEFLFKDIPEDNGEHIEGTETIELPVIHLTEGYGWIEDLKKKRKYKVKAALSTLGESDCECNISEDCQIERAIWLQDKFDAVDLASIQVLWNIALGSACISTLHGFAHFSESKGVVTFSSLCANGNDIGVKLLSLALNKYKDSGVVFNPTYTDADENYSIYKRCVLPKSTQTKIYRKISLGGLN